MKHYHMNVEFYILSFLLVVRLVAWLLDKWRAWKWRHSKRAKEAEHVRALAAQLCTAREWARSSSSSQTASSSGSTEEQQLLVFLPGPQPPVTSSRTPNERGGDSIEQA